MKKLAVLFVAVLAAALLTPASAGAGDIPIATVTIEKVVVGDAPDDAEFTVVAECIGTEGVQLMFGPDGGSESADGFETEFDCTVTETDDGGASSVSYSCEAVGLPQDVQCDSDDSFQIDANDLNDDASVTVTVTNTFDPEPTTTVAPTTVAPTTTAAAQAVTAAPAFTG